jgi:hypothetical protein
LVLLVLYSANSLPFVYFVFWNEKFNTHQFLFSLDCVYRFFGF